MNPRLPTGQTLTLMCDVSGKPFPKLVWYRDDISIETTSDKIVLGPDSRYVQVCDKI